LILQIVRMNCRTIFSRMGSTKFSKSWPLLSTW
jgi:hypothetical protein